MKKALIITFSTILGVFVIIGIVFFIWICQLNYHKSYPLLYCGTFNDKENKTTLVVEEINKETYDKMNNIGTYYDKFNKKYFSVEFGLLEENKVYKPYNLRFVYYHGFYVLDDDYTFSLTLQENFTYSTKKVRYEVNYYKQNYTYEIEGNVA